jgi:O-antigen ligase
LTPFTLEYDVKVRSARSRSIAKSAALLHGLGGRVGLIGVCVYLIGAVLPIAWDIPFILLGVCGAVAFITESKPTAGSWPPLTLPIVLFLVSTGVSTIFSDDIGRSIRLGASLLPALLLFFLIAQHVDGVRDVRIMFLTCSVVVLVVSTALLLTGWYDYNEKGLKGVITHLGIPLLVVPNDVTFLAVIAPLSVALFYDKPRSMTGIGALISILLSVGAICAFRSRTAALTTIITVTCAVILMQSQQQRGQGALYALAFLVLTLLIDGLLGFPLIAKVIRKATILGRMSYWSTAWQMFLGAPLLGHGPHTFGLFHKTPWAHNLYLEVLAEQGMIGFGALIALLASGMRMAWRVYRTAVGEVRFFGASVLAAFVGFCAASLFELSFVRQWVVLMLFVLLGIMAQLRQSQT